MSRRSDAIARLANAYHANNIAFDKALRLLPIDRMNEHAEYWEGRAAAADADFQRETPPPACESIAVRKAEAAAEPLTIRDCKNIINRVQARACVSGGDRDGFRNFRDSLRRYHGDGPVD